MKLGKYKLTIEGLYKEAPKDRAWKWDLIIPLFQKKKVYQRKGELEYKTHNFDSFFDDTRGMRICSIEEIRDRERKGEVILTHEEAKKITQRQQEHLKQQTKQKSRRSLEKNLRRVMQGERNIKVEPYL